MPRVYVPNKGIHDYSAASRFGDLVFCSEGIIPRFNTGTMLRYIVSAMKDSDPRDYILITSLTTLNALACAYFAHKHGRLNLLLFQPNDWKSKQGDYLKRTIFLDQPEKEMKDDNSEQEPQESTPST